jgi:predicted esterase
MVSRIRRMALIGALAIAVGVPGIGPLPCPVATAKDDGPPEREPGPKATGKIYTWKAEDGLAYDFYLPKSYDPEKGITLTLILHGSNGWKGWGFGMHAAGEFRPDDFVVSPEGTTPNGNGGFNSLQSGKDLKRFHALHQQLKKLVKVNATYVYGLSQGSFFAHFYAGHHGDEVDGIVAHGSGLWLGSGLKKKNHHQAIAVMHGRGDPVVEFSAGVSAHGGYADVKYPTLKLRALELDLHWAPWMHQAQQLAWCEAMTTEDPERLVHNFEWMEKVKDSDGWLFDPVAGYQVAERVTTTDGVDPKTRAAAAKMMKSIEAIAARHVTEIQASYDKSKKKVTKSATWPMHAHYFLRDWRGVPAADAWAKAWKKTIGKQIDEAQKARVDYWQALQKGKPDKAFSAGVDVVEKGPLSHWATEAGMLANLLKWRADAKSNGISSAAAKRYDKVVQPFLDGRERGKKAYASLNKKL